MPGSTRSSTDTDLRCDQKTPGGLGCDGRLHAQRRPRNHGPGAELGVEEAVIKRCRAQFGEQVATFQPPLKLGLTFALGSDSLDRHLLPTTRMQLSTSTQCSLV